MLYLSWKDSNLFPAFQINLLITVVYASLLGLGVLLFEIVLLGRKSSMSH